MAGRANPRPNQLGSVKRDAVSEFVDYQGFRDLMAFIEPEYTMLLRRTITARLERMYIEKREPLKASLKLNN